MASNKNIFYASNPLNLLDALWSLIKDKSDDLSEVLIFLPSRRAVRSVEKMLVEKKGSAIILPSLVALGEGAEDGEEPDEILPDVISNLERVVVLTKLLSADPSIKNLSTALPIAQDLVRMQDYMENEGIDSKEIIWEDVVNHKYANHFQHKARFLDILTKVLPSLFLDKLTSSQKRNQDIRNWTSHLDNKQMIIVCGSTVSVPATADLMEKIYNLENGYIILPGKIDGRKEDLLLESNPYNSEFKFLERIGFDYKNIKLIDTGKSNIDFFNAAFSNSGIKTNDKIKAQLIECDRESEEAEVVAKIAQEAISSGKTALVITPDAAGNQRIKESFLRLGIEADFSAGKSGTMTLAGRAILNMLDKDLEEKRSVFQTGYRNNSYNLLNTIVNLIDENEYDFAPAFDIESAESIEVWEAIAELSKILDSHDIRLNLADARAIIYDCLGAVSARPPMNDALKVSVLGTIESRMQSADVIILTGLNEGMFPSIGYENPWLPRHVSEEIGLPSPNRKVSLMALDFINLSCGTNVFWTRSKTAGSNKTTESRFLSRIDVLQNGISKETGTQILNQVRARDKLPLKSLDYSAPRPPADRTDVYVTEIESLINNPYAFYVGHILRLYPQDDYWEDASAKEFGILVHRVIENGEGKSEKQLIDEMENGAKKLLPKDSIIFHFWNNRFKQIAPWAKKMLDESQGAKVEIRGAVNIAGRIVRAKADRIWDGHVMDVKTGNAPNKKQLTEGNMPQLPLEAYIMQNGGFSIPQTYKSKTPAIHFLQLKNNDIKHIIYQDEDVQKMIEGSVKKVSELFGRYSNDYEPYEYYERSEPRFKKYDDLARVDD